MPWRAETNVSSEAAPLPIVRTVGALRTRIRGFRQAGETVALVPTMGALHEGHLELAHRAGAACDRVVATLFVNPKQFDRPDDLERYPRTEARDAELLAGAGCHLLFAPPAEEVYPDGFATTVSVAGVTGSMEGAHRPGHFDGVATVVTKLLLQGLPDIAFFGEKDYQQLQTIRRMVRDLDIPVAIEGVPTVREADGLALSSRNRNLTAEQRRIAPALAKTLYDIAARLSGGGVDAGLVLDEGREALLRAGFDSVDYLELRDSANLTPLAQADRPARLLAAAWLGHTRLIDNVPVE
ncbi:pantoate--beta-alanine ligase [Ferruginivarius sediminum]|uniref:Pantothenate synthetase n=1 Tax=Ferruginivarius sediminum TaxID=2661937 RepID=A0A369TFB7_9PROT|nr:pantoate--beta-alanine ligase [Ferruginivarius sediminum]RDD63075.1 pantoate--beta-alanine ligase [Ferruginivarius sediminum]